MRSPKIVAVNLFFAFMKLVYAKTNPSTDIWVELLYNSSAGLIEERCKKLDEAIYLGFGFFDGLYTVYL